MLSLRFLSSISLLTNFRRFVHMSSAHSVGIRRYYYGYDERPIAVREIFWGRMAVSRSPPPIVHRR